MSRFFPGLPGAFSAPQQFAVDVGDLLQARLHTMIVVNPATHLLDLVGGNRRARAVRLVQSDAQIPDRPVPLASRTLAVRLAAGQIALHQRTPKDLPQGRQKLSQTLAPAAQGERGESREILSFCHMAANIITPDPENASANFASANLLLSY